MRSNVSLPLKPCHGGSIVTVAPPGRQTRANQCSKGAGMANSPGYHESESKLRPETLDNHRALTSMQEELEAADWYDQRVDAATDADLKAILKHNHTEESEHFSITL